MKNLFAILLSTLMLCAFSNSSNAQIIKTYSVVGKSKTDTLGSAADTAHTSLLFDGSFKSIELYALKISGTVSAKHYFEGKTLDGNNWVKIDSLTIADQAGDQYKIISVPSPRTYAAYRVSSYSATGTIRVKVYACRYTGG